MDDNDVWDVTLALMTAIIFTGIKDTSPPITALEIAERIVKYIVCPSSRNRDR